MINPNNALFMIKKIILLTALFAMVASASAQDKTLKWFDFSQNSEQASIGFHLGAAGVGTDYGGIAGGVSMSVLGFYADFIIAPPDNTTDTHVLDQRVDDDRAFTISIGYHIPILPWLRLTPIIGYSNTSYGNVDMSTVNIVVDDDYSGHIEHEYTPVEPFHEFNFGGGLFVKPVEFLDIYGIWTLRAIYGGISINISSLVTD